MRKASASVVLLALVFASAGTFAAPIIINGVPDWNQPVSAGVVGLGAGWDAWCVPTAAANIMGYYRDKGTLGGVADAKVFPQTNAWGPPFTGNWQDTTADPNSSNPPVAGIARADLGWYMNTNDTGQMGGANPHAGTFWGDIKPGLDGTQAGHAGWAGYFPAHGVNASVQNAATAASGQNTDPLGPFTVATVWGRVVTEISAGRPMIGSFSSFPGVGSYIGAVNATLGNYEYAIWPTNPPNGDPTTGEVYAGDLGHSVTLVGYWNANDPLSPFWNGNNSPNCLIVYDNRDGYRVANGTGLPLVIPFDAGGFGIPAWVPPWVMNTEIAVPEPATVTAGALLLGSLTARWRRTRRGRVT